MFKFNFQSPPSAENGNNSEKSCEEDNNDDVQWLPAKEHVTSEEHRTRLSETNSFKSVLLRDESFIHLLDSSEVSKCLREETEALKGTKDSDLVPGVYEGGLKIWECSEDLLEYLDEISEEDNEDKTEFPILDLKGLRVLELGCGAGLPGLLCAARGASEVHLQDYNPEVIDRITIPNALNNDDEKSAPKFKFFSGDWDSLASLLESMGDKYDLILTAETIYNVSNQEKLLRLFDVCLPEVGGRVLLGAKTHYFGVGGGMRQFEALMEGEKWEFRTVRAVDAGVKREIIEIKRK